MDEHCAYCGRGDSCLEREHVVPKCLYPPRASRTQRITVGACRDCNASWSADEAHFRNVAILAGDPNPAVLAVWPKTQRSFGKEDGHRRLEDIWRHTESVKVGGDDRLMIYPGRDDRVLRVVRKVVRGLSHYHGLSTITSDDRVWVDVLKYQAPPGLLDQMRRRTCETDVFQYWFTPMVDDEWESAWLLKFYERLPFIAVVARDAVNLITTDCIQP